MGLNDLLSTIEDIKKQDTRGKAAGAMNQAYGTDPDQYAEFIRLEKDTGRPASWMAEDSTIADEAKRSTFLDGRKLEMLPSHVQNYLSVPDNAKVSHDDLDGLTGIANVFDKVKRGIRSIGASAYSTSQGLWAIPEAVGDFVQGGTKPLAEITGLPLDIGGAISEIARGERQKAEYWAKRVRGDNSKAGLVEGSIYQGLESFGGNLLMIPATIMSGSPTPMLTGMSASAGGKSYGEARDKGLSPLQSAIHGASQGSIEYATEMIPAAKFVKAMGSKTLFSKAIKSVLGPDIVGEQVATVLQDLNDWVALNPEKTFSDYLDERPSAAAETLIATIVGTGGMVATAKGLQKAGQSFESYAEAKKQSDFLIALGDSVKASKTFARLPDNVKDLIRNIKQDGDVHDIFVPVEKINQLFQSKGLNAEQQMQQILSEPSRYYEALATGGDVAIPLEDFAALAGDEIYGELIGDARTHIDGMSMNEAKQFDKPEFQAEYVKSLLDEADKIGAETTFQTETEQSAYQQFYDDTYGQLIGIGRNAEQSDKEATLRAKMLTTLMQRGGYSAEYLQEMFPVTITRGPLPEALQKPKGADAIAYESQIGAMIDKLRSGKAPKPSELFGPSLLEFLRDKGIQDQGGELSRMDIDKGQKFKKKVVRSDGMTFDKAREAAVEAGYLPEDSTVADFLNLVDQEARGNAVYSTQSGNQTLQDEALSLQQLQQWIDDMGIDLQTSDNAKLLQLMQKSAEGGSQLNQQKRGYIQFTKGVPGFEIALLKDADASTFIHELSHYYFEILGTLAGQEGAPDRIKADYESLLKWLGAESTESLTVRQKEHLADGFLEYMTEGKAPSTELQGVFSRFKTWLKAIYLTFKNADVQLTDEVRQIFDRWLATDEEIETARNQVEAKPMFTTAKDAGMSERVFEAYKKLAEDAHEAAKSRLDAVKYKEANRVYQAWWEEALAGITAEVEQEARDNPVFEALNVIRNGELFDGTKFEGGSSRLNGAVLKRMYDAPTLKAFARKLGPFYQNEGGINPEDMAEMFGFGSADEMIRKMVEAPKMKDWVKAEAQKRMEERYPEKNSSEIADDALAAVNNDDLARVFREELKAIKRKQKEVKPFLKAEEQDKKATREEAFDSIPPLVFFKDAAKQHIASMKITDIKPGLYARAEQKAGKEAIELNGKDKFVEAAAAKQRQILNHYLYREATEAKERADKTLSYMRKLEAGKKQSALGKAGQEYLDQINNILDQYEFRRIPLREIEARESLLDWVLKKEEETGQKFPIDPVLLADAEQVNYRTLTVGKLDEIYKTAKLIDFLAMNHNKLLKDQQKRDLMEIGDEVAAGVELYGGKKKPRQPEKSLPQDMPGKLLRNYFAGMRAMSSLARQMDGGQDGGVVWQTLIRPLNEAGDNESAMHAAATDRADKIFSVYSAKERMTMTLRKMVPGSDISLSHWGRLMVVLNMGNEGNLDRLRATLSDKDIAAVLDSLNERDLKFVQDVWDWLESFKPQIAAKEKRVNGIEPEWVVATPVQTRFGTLTGGYFPIFYDLVESERAEALDAKTIEMQMNGGMFSHATTRRGHLEARLDHIGRPLDLDISNIFNHVNQVIHDLTHHETLIDLNKIMNLQSVKDSMRDYYGPEAYRIFRDGITDVAVGTIPARNAWEWWNQYTRVGATTAALGWNITTSLLQPLGLTQSIVRIGPEYVAKGVMQWLGSPKKMYSEIPEMIYSKSTFMKHRAQSMNRELAEVSGKIKPGVVPHVIKDSYFFLIQEMQKVVDIPTWLGQYEKSMTAHGNEADAIAEADQAVIDAQAHGQQKDLSRFQRGGPFEKLFTMFSSYFVRTWNLAAESYGQTNFKSAASVGKFTVDMMMLYVIPAAITSAVFDVAIQAAIGGDPDEDKFWMGFFSKMIGGVIAPLPGVNQLGSLLSGYMGYEGPAGTRIYSEISKAAKQIGQGESDWALWKSIIGTGGVLFHAPTGQTIKSISGIMELQEGNGNVLSLMFGKPKK